MSRSLAAARRLAAFPLALGVLLAVAPLPMLAHADLVESSPAANASLVEAPRALTLTFSEPIDGDTVVVELLDAEESTVDGVGVPQVSADGLDVEVSLPDLAPAAYTVSYQVVSTIDGHATAGIFAFLVDPTGAAPPPTDSASSSSPSVDAFTVAARWLALAMMLVALGSLVLWWNAGHAVLSHRGPPWRLIGTASALAALGVASYLALAARPLSGSDGTGIPLDIAAPFGWTPFAIAMRAAFLAALIAAAMSVVGERWKVGHTLALATGAVLACGLGGMSLAAHAAATGGPGFAAIDWLHLVAVAAWLGALPAAVALAARAAPDRRAVLAAILRRHGRVALVAAPVVALTGIANSPLVLGSARDVVASDYGNLLVAKAGLLSVALGIGAVNHLALRGRGRAAVAALVGAEVVVAALAVSAAATMVTIQPASARQPDLATTPVNPAHFFGEIGPSRVHLSVSVPAPGNQTYRVVVTEVAGGGPREDVQKVFLAFEPPPSSELPPVRVELEPDPLGAGLYVANGAYTPLVGEWQLELLLRRAGERDESLPFELPVTAPGAPEPAPPADTGIGVPGPIAAAWSILPPGLLGWLPAALALVALVVLGRVPPSVARGMARGAAVVLLLAGVAAVGSRSLVTAANAPNDADLARQPPVNASADRERGESVYRANCASCHGLEGKGDGPVRTQPTAGSLSEAVSSASDAELSYRIAYGVAGTPMPSFAGRLTPHERADLVAYLRQRWGDE